MLRTYLLTVLVALFATSASAQTLLEFSDDGVLAGVLDAFNIEDNGCEYCTNSVPLAFQYTGTPDLNEIYWSSAFNVDPEQRAIPLFPAPRIFPDDTVQMVGGDTVPTEGWTQMDFVPLIDGFMAFSTGDLHGVTANCPSDPNDSVVVQNDWFWLECPGGIDRIRYETLGGLSGAVWDTVTVPEPGFSGALASGLFGLAFMARYSRRR